MFHRFLWKGAHLPGFYGLLGMLFPIAVTITVLAQLNPERSTWELMAGIRQTTAADLSYQWLFLLTVISVYSMAVVIPVYLICCAFRFADMRKKEKPAPNIDDDEGRAA